MDATDKTDRSGRKRRLIVAEEARGSSQPDGEFIAVDGHTEIAD